MSLRIQYRVMVRDMRGNPTPRGDRQAHERCLTACGILRAGGHQAVPYQGSVYTTASRDEWTEATIEHAWLRVGAVVHSEER